MLRSINFFEHSLPFPPSHGFVLARHRPSSSPFNPRRSLGALDLPLKTATGFSGSPDATHLFPSFATFSTPAPSVVRRPTPPALLSYAPLRISFSPGCSFPPLTLRPALSSSPPPLSVHAPLCPLASVYFPLYPFDVSSFPDPSPGRSSSGLTSVRLYLSQRSLFPSPGSPPSRSLAYPFPAIAVKLT